MNFLTFGARDFALIYEGWPQEIQFRSQQAFLEMWRVRSLASVDLVDQSSCDTSALGPVKDFISAARNTCVLNRKSPLGDIPKIPYHYAPIEDEAIPLIKSLLKFHGFQLLTIVNRMNTSAPLN